MPSVWVEWAERPSAIGNLHNFEEIAQLVLRNCPMLGRPDFRDEAQKQRARRPMLPENDRVANFQRLGSRERSVLGCVAAYGRSTRLCQILLVSSISGNRIELHWVAMAAHGVN